MDYHTAKTQDEKTSYVTYRHYLQDAVFLAGIESTDTALLQQLQQALLHPAFPLYLGRRCCPPTLPLCLGVCPGSLQEVLQAEPPLCLDGRAGSYWTPIRWSRARLRSGMCR